MNPTPVWFERKFDFSLPIEALPEVLARLRAAPGRLEDSLRGFSADVLIAKVGGKWSPQEQAGHLLDLEPLWLARAADYMSEEDELTAADLTNRKTDQANHNARSLEEILQAFRVERERLLHKVDETDVLFFARSIPHPRLRTPMRLLDHLYFVAEHDEHHLARIGELITRLRV